MMTSVSLVEGAGSVVMVVVVDSTDGVMIVGSLVIVTDSWRMDVVSAVLEALAPVSVEAGVPIVSSALLWQPTSATKNAAINKLFFIFSFLIVAEKEGRKLALSGLRLFETQNIRVRRWFST